MPRADGLERMLERLADARRDPTSAESLALLASALRGRSGHAAAKAAAIAAEFEIGSLSAELVRAFERFLVNPVKTDPGCAAKLAIADALYKLGAPELSVYRTGIRHVQMEPVWGGKADTATALRGTCALALVRIHDPDALLEIAELLADKEAPARKMAAQALAYSENPAAAPLLRLKARIGDDDPQVVGECLLALLAVAPRASLEFVAGFLDRDQPEYAEAAALALGGSRLREALPILVAWWDRTVDATLRRTALLALAMLKTDDALELLLTHVAESAPIHARNAIHALAIYRHDPRLRAQVLDALAKRDDRTLRTAFDEAFGEE